jgi:ribosome-associated heat shock protein Hsp15
MAESLGRVRADKWLWAARFYKTRSLATEAIAGGKVHVNGERVKPAKLVQVGDVLEVRQGPYEFHLVVRGLAERRGPAAAAAALYEESAASREGRERVAAQLKVMHAAFVPEQKGRPTKRDRRAIERLKRRD